ncbi:MAG: alpha/beta hydrolase [Polyangiaceae bacterium]
MTSVALPRPLLSVDALDRFLEAADDSPLPPAIDAEKKVLRTRRKQEVAYYVSAPRPPATRGEGARDHVRPPRPLLLVHSVNAAASAYEMRPLFERYRGDRTVVAMDLPGYGASERDRRTYTPELFADAILDVAERVASKGVAPDVVALSLGCEFTALAALARPDAFASLTFLSPTGFSAKENAVQAAGRSSRSDMVFRILDTPVLSPLLYRALTSRPSLRHYLRKSFVGPVDEGLLAHARATSARPGARFAPFHFLAGKLFTPDVADRVYAALDVPTHVVFDEDAYVTFDRLSEIERANPKITSTRILPSRGLVHFELPDATARTLEAFWARTHARTPHRRASERGAHARAN